MTCTLHLYKVVGYETEVALETFKLLVCKIGYLVKVYPVFRDKPLNLIVKIVAQRFVKSLSLIPMFIVTKIQH